VTFNVFIAVILEAYDESENRDAAEISNDQLSSFAAAWALFDSKGDQKIPLSSVIPLLNRVETPLGYLSSRMVVTAANHDSDTYDVEDIDNADIRYRHVPRSVLILRSDLNLLPNEVKLGKLEIKTIVHMIPNPEMSKKMLPEFDLQVRQNPDNVSEPNIYFLEFCLACTKRAYVKRGILIRNDLIVNTKLIQKAISNSVQEAPDSNRVDAAAYLSVLRIAGAYRQFKFRKSLHDKVLAHMRSKEPIISNVETPEKDVPSSPDIN